MSAGHFWILWCCTCPGRVLGRVNGAAVAYPWIVALLQADSQPRLGTLLLISSPLPPSLIPSPPNSLLPPPTPFPLIRAPYLAGWHRCIGE